MFAIAIRLLVLDIRVPVTEFDDLWHGIAHEWPSYVGYVTSFTTIGAVWLAHHGIFRRLAYVDASVMRLNLLLLMVVAFIRSRPASRPKRSGPRTPSARRSSSTG